MQGQQLERKKKCSRLVDGRKRKKREKFSEMCWIYIYILDYKLTIANLDQLAASKEN